MKKINSPGVIAVIIGAILFFVMPGILYGGRFTVDDNHQNKKETRPPDPGGITLLKTRGGIPATKKYIFSGGKVTLQGYGNAKHFSVTTATVASIAEFETLHRTLVKDPYRLIIRGSLINGTSPKKVRRLSQPDEKDGTPAAFQETDRWWWLWDVDHHTCSFNVDPSNPDHLTQAAAEIRNTLPPPFCNTACVVVWSSRAFLEIVDGQLVIDPRKAKAHLWFLLDRPVCGEAWRDYADVHKEAHNNIDPALASCVQPHYTAAPVFEGLQDPLCERVWLIDGTPRACVDECDPPLFDGAEYRRRQEEAERVRQEERERARKKREASSHTYEGDGLRERILVRVTCMDVFEHHGMASKTQEERGETRLLGNGGLFVDEDNNRWNVPAEKKTGGGIFEAWQYAKHGNVNVPTGREFSDMLKDMAEAFGVESETPPRSKNNGATDGVSPMKKVRDLRKQDNRPSCLLPTGIEIQSKTALDCAQSLNNPPVMFVRGREVIRLVRSREQVKLVPYTSMSLFEDLTERIRFTRLAMKEAEDGQKTFTEEDKDISVFVCSNILERSSWPFPPIEEVIRFPVLAPGGELVTQSGYRPDLLAYVDLGGLRVSVPTHPTEQQILEAKSLIIDDLLCDFPFVDASSKAHAVALGVLPYVRHMIDAVTPPHLTSATASRTGKSLLVTLLAIIATGEDFRMLAPTEQEDEWRKRITTLLKNAPALVCIDNVNKRLDSASLASLFTARTWTDRALGGNTEVTYRNNVTWAITANNPQASEELTKRCVWIGLDAKMENPDERTRFKHPRIIQWVKDNRQALMEAFLTLVQAWNAKGRPSGEKSFGSFEVWADVIGGILDVAGIPCFLDNRKALIARTSADSQEWKQFVAVWWKKYPEELVKVSSLRALATESELLGRVMGDKSEKSQDTKLGNALLKRQDRIFELEAANGQTDTVLIKKEENKHTKSYGWKLERMTLPTSGEI